MSLKIKLSFFLSITLSANFSIAQTSQNNFINKYRAIHWGLNEGLSQGETYHFLKDANGFLWVGTRYGLDRFDGATFKVYLPERNNTKSIISYKLIGGLVEDSLHNIWIGSEDKGVSRYNIKTDDFTNFYPGSEKKPSAGTIYPFCATKNEVWCIENDASIIAYDIYTSAKRILANLSDIGQAFIIINETYSIYDKNSNTVWLLMTNKERKVFLREVNLSSNQKSAFEFPYYSPDYLDAEAMCYDTKRNCIWINGNKGLIQFTLSDKQFHHIKALSKYEHVKDYSRFVGVTLDKQGRVWFATKPLGMIIYDPDNDSVSFPFSDFNTQKEIADANACLYCDRDGIIWSGFWLRKGIDGIFPFNPIVKHYPSSEKKDSLNGNLVIGAKDAGAGKIWVGSSSGIFILDKETGSFKALPKQYLYDIKGSFMSAIAIDTMKQKAWLMADGIFRMDMSAKKNTSIIFKTLKNRITNNTGIPKLDGQQIFSTSQDDSGFHVYVLNLMSDTASEILSLPPNLFNIFFTTPVENHFLFLQGNADEKNNRTYENKNGKWILIHTPIDSIRWDCLFFEKENNSYWVAGENQLFHLDKSFKLLKIYSKEDGLPQLPIVGLIRDNNGNIWFHTDRSIQELNVTTGQIKTMSEADGFEKELFEGLPFADKDADGNIYYGGGTFGSGLDKISPNNFVPTVSSVYLKSLTINQKLFPLKTSINYTDTLPLKYNQTKIEIETGIIDFYSGGESRIRFKLEKNGLHESWQYAPYYYTIRYDGLEPGDYRLIIQASNSSNLFNGSEKILHLHITPPFWQTWWFRVLAIIALVVIVYAIVQYRSRNLKKQNVALEEKVMHRTKELKHSLEELRTTQEQLIQSEKMASLGELTSGIAHEIKNPLNFIKNFSEINIELISEIEEEQLPNIDESMRAEITPVIKTLKKNAEKINHHGNRIDGIVKGMLQHSRIGNVKKEATDINVLCDESLKLAYNGFRAKEKAFSATFETHFEHGLPKLMMVPQDIGRVLINLINNAFYTVNEKKKSSRLNLSPDAVQTDVYKPCVIVSTKKYDNKIHIVVSDNGMGIPAQIINKICQPFFTTKPTGEGTGLGLSMSYDIITKGHDGELNVKSEEGKGTDFEIILPAS